MQNVAVVPENKIRDQGNDAPPVRASNEKDRRVVHAEASLTRQAAPQIEGRASQLPRPSAPVPCGLVVEIRLAEPIIDCDNSVRTSRPGLRCFELSCSFSAVNMFSPGRCWSEDRKSVV